MSQFLVRNAGTMPPNISLKEPLPLNGHSRSTSTPKTSHDHDVNQPKPKPNPNLSINAQNPIKVQTEFMDAMTNAIIRFLDKHDDSTKTNAEQSVFIALGYDVNIESDPTMARRISHFRRHHIMRNRDAIRTFRIKTIHENIMKEYPHYNDNDVLIHLTDKLNSIYLPSPSPPPIKPMEQCNNMKSNENILSNYLETLHDNKEEETDSLKSNTNITQCNVIKEHILDTSKAKKRNNVNYTINQCPNNKQMNKPKVKKPSQNIRIGLNNDRIKYKKKKKKTKSITNKKHFLLPKRPYLVDGYPPNPYLQSSQHVYMMDDEVTQKIKLHKQSRKRKFTFNEFEQNSFEFDNKQPPKKRTRKGHSVYASKGRNIYHTTDCFEDEEDQGSDIDLNEASQTTNSHL